MKQRADLSREIVDLGHDYGDDVNESGSVTAALHRGWISLKDALTGDDAGCVLGAVVTGENHAVSEYERALEQDLSSGFREVVTRQHAAVVAARDEIKARKNSWTISDSCDPSAFKPEYRHGSTRSVLQ